MRVDTRRSFSVVHILGNMCLGKSGHLNRSAHAPGMSG